MAAPKLALAWVALWISILAMSSGGVWFALLKTTPPVLMASWRLILTATLQAPAFAWQWWQASAAAKQHWLRNLPLMLVTGFLLAIHFETWAVSLKWTSLAHSLLFVTTTPFIYVAVYLARFLIARALHKRRGGWGAGGAPAPSASASEGDHVELVPPVPSHAGAAAATVDVLVDTAPVSSLAPESPVSVPATPLDACAADAPPPAATADAPPETKSAAAPPPVEVPLQRLSCSSVVQLMFPRDVLPPTRLEIGGVLVGTGAAAALALTHDSSGGAGPQVTVAGDLMAFAGAVSVAFYLSVGAKLRQGMPLFLYAFPVTACAAVCCAAMALWFEPEVTWTGLLPTSMWGWLGTSERFWLNVGAAFGAGILGHTLCNFALGSISSLIVSVLLLLEPAIGSAMGYAAGVQGPVGPVTVGAGLVLLVSALLVTVGERGAIDKMQASYARWRQQRAGVDSARAPP